MNPADLGRALEHATCDTPNARCPRCQKIINRATSIAHTDPPRPGDVTVCSPCGAILEFQPDLALRLMTDAEVAALGNETLLALLDGIESAALLERLRAAYHRIQAPGPA